MFQLISILYNLTESSRFRSGRLFTKIFSLLCSDYPQRILPEKECWAQGAGEIIIDIYIFFCPEELYYILESNSSISSSIDFEQ